MASLPTPISGATASIKEMIGSSPSSNEIFECKGVCIVTETEAACSAVMNQLISQREKLMVESAPPLSICSRAIALLPRNAEKGYGQFSDEFLSQIGKIAKFNPPLK